MRLAALVAAGLVAMSGSALAQYVPRPMAPVGSSSAQDAVEIVQAMGLDPIGPAMRSGPFYVQSARDDFGRVLRVTVDARRSQVVAVEPGVPRALYGPDAGYVPQYPRYPLHRGPDFALAPPGSVMAPHGQPPQIGLPPAAQPKPAAKSAAVTPGRPPAPRKRPPSAPQEAAGSIEPLQAAPQPASPAAAPPAATAKPAAPTMPPVAPLE
jgi:hypothetical protein